VLGAGCSLYPWLAPMTGLSISLAAESDVNSSGSTVRFLECVVWDAAVLNAVGRVSLRAAMLQAREIAFMLLLVPRSITPSQCAPMRARG
jgi:hypothetical protein